MPFTCVCVHGSSWKWICWLIFILTAEVSNFMNIRSLVAEKLRKQNWLCIFIIFKCIFRYYLIIHVFLFWKTINTKYSWSNFNNQILKCHMYRDKFHIKYCPKTVSTKNSNHLKNKVSIERPCIIVASADWKIWNKTYSETYITISQT